MIVAKMESVVAEKGQIFDSCCQDVIRMIACDRLAEHFVQT